MKDTIVLLVSSLAGFSLLGYDQRTDDTGVEAGLILALSLAFSLAAPHRAIAVGLGVSLPIAASSALNGRMDVAAVVLVIGMVGAGLGWLMRRGSAAAR